MISVIYTCDRCGSKIKIGTRNSSIWYGRKERPVEGTEMTVADYDENCEATFKNYTLCPECSAILKRFLEQIPDPCTKEVKEC